MGIQTVNLVKVKKVFHILANMKENAKAKEPINSRMEPDILDIINRIKNMDQEYFIIQMVQFMKEIGKMILKTEKVLILILTKIHTAETGKMTKDMDMERIHTSLLQPYTRDNGILVMHMDLENSFLILDVNRMENIFQLKNRLMAKKKKI